MANEFLKRIREIDQEPGRLEAVIDQALRSPNSPLPAQREEGVMFAAMALATLHLSQNADRIKLPVDPAVAHDLREVIDAGLKDPDAHVVLTAEHADRALTEIQGCRPTAPSGRPKGVQLPRFSRE